MIRTLTRDGIIIFGSALLGITVGMVVLLAAILVARISSGLELLILLLVFMGITEVVSMFKLMPHIADKFLT